VNNAALQINIGRNVVELNFVRRHKKAQWSDIRGMFGTTNYELLNGDFGAQVLNFRPPKGIGMGYDYKHKNLCVIWDIFRQEYRVFGAEQCNVKKTWDVTTPEGIEEFKTYFYDNIINMSNDDKLEFMGYVGEEKVIHTPNVSPQTKNSIYDRIKKVGQSFVDRMKQYIKGKKSN